MVELCVFINKYIEIPFKSDSKKLTKNPKILSFGYWAGTVRVSTTDGEATTEYHMGVWTFYLDSETNIRHRSS